MPERFVGHLRSLGLRSFDDYYLWCDQNGFGRGVNKPKQMFARELEYRRTTAKAAFENQVRVQKRSPQATLLGLVSGEVDAANLSERSYREFAALLASFRQHGGKLNWHRPVLSRLIEHLLKVRSRIVDDSNRSLANDNRFQSAAWKASGIGGFEFREGSLEGGNLKGWTNGLKGWTNGLKVWTDGSRSRSGRR